MGWFENQIEERRDADRRLLEDSFIKAAGVVMGEQAAVRLRDERIVTKNAIDEILKYYHFKTTDIPEGISDPDEQLDYCLRPHGVMHRTVELKEGWYRDAYGPMLARTKADGSFTALIPGRMKGYYFRDPETGRMKKTGAKEAEIFGSEAECFYKPLPQRSLGIHDLLVYLKNCISTGDIVMLAAAALSASLAGLVIPRLTKALTGPVLSSGSTTALMGAAVCMFCAVLSSQLLSSTEGLISSRLDIKTSMGVQSSMMMRIMTLPASFFRDYSPGELKSRASAVNQLCSILIGMVVNTVVTSLASLLYITQIFRYADALVVPVLLILLVTVTVSVISTLMMSRIERIRLDAAARESGMSYSMISGIQKLKLAGAEKRIFAKWLNLFSEIAEIQYNPPMFIKINSVITLAVTLVSNIVIYYLSVRSGISQSSYFAFTSAFGMVMGAFTGLSSIALSAAQIKPILEVAEPFLRAEPEISENKEIVTKISGGVELDHVYFRYGEDLPYVLKDMSVKIKPGDYVAIVGKTGCGKSTIIRLLLGFEKPEKGAVYYDGRDLNSLDPGSLRSRIGTVMQSSGLFQGDIYSNIVISAPELTLKDAWDAAERAGIADVIREMPMGMNTVVSEGSGGISGGQKQRIMIARAIAPNPKLLIFDEATSALDNKTQKQVSEALDSMGCTRIVIAHRLSTIRNCDRILVMDDGRIAEDGTYDELIEKGGLFADLVERQRINIG